MKQGLDTIPQNLNADAHEEKGREPQDDAHAAFADDCGETIGKTVTKKNAQRHERRTNDRRKNGKEIRAQVVGLICSESDGDRNRTGTDGERQSQRIKSIAENILQVDLFLDRSEEHTSELQSPCNLVCRLLLEKKKKSKNKLNAVMRLKLIVTNHCIQ